ncbi:hypothetical protein SPSIL_055780 [Sporomusa silvacetica DSM 10669]|uniref:Uncharacterized protein n=1 Tax=Sporomusa silvacetica DSM 10669 TaxID=1123289 RepID=A0ABZ3IUU2_9FIRM|nr:hypothetical protein [Sporomusa silvacetica]OZC23900.1 hypothetical protein SPSIL_00610 [Sporomusa silvacetica DSM 10669]
MPRTEPLPAEELQKVENGLKREIAGARSNISDTARRLNEIYDSADTPITLARQIRQGTIPHWKVLRIADVLGYEIVWKKKEPRQ